MSSGTPIKHTEHTILEHHSVRLPYEVSRKNFRTAHRIIEKDSSTIQAACKESANKALKAVVNDGAAAVKEIDSIIAQVEELKKKLQECQVEEKRQNRKVEARLRHVDELFDIQHYEDPAYERWAGTRLDRFIAEYMLQKCYMKSAELLAQEQGIEDLIDIDIRGQWAKIQNGLNDHNLAPLIAWCSENKKELRKMESDLEFQIRLQQYIELIRENKRFDVAIKHMRKYVLPYQTSYPAEVTAACGLIAFDASSESPLWAPSRWNMISERFANACQQLYSLSSQPALLVAMRLGISTMKSRTCKIPQIQPELCQMRSPSDPRDVAAMAADLIGRARAGSAGSLDDTMTVMPQQEYEDLSDVTDEMEVELHMPLSDDFDDNRQQMSSPGAPGDENLVSAADLRALLCPVCSTELQELAAPMPYAFHTHSSMDSDMVMMPRGNVYAKKDLIEYAEKMGLPEGMVVDLRKPGMLHVLADLQKVYIT